MPVIENLKNFIHRDRDHHASPPRSNNNASSGAHSASPSKRHHNQQPQQPQAHQAPNSAMQAQYAAYAPEPHTRSEARGFGAENPAAAPAHAAGGQAAGYGYAGASGSAQTGTKPLGHSPGVDPTARERAERIVMEQKAARAKLPYYEGLPAQFELMEKMGDGAFSNVYKAYDRVNKRQVAIKCVRKYELSNNQRANILKEVQIMRGLRHDGIVELISFTESKEHYYLVLELMPGGELFHQIVKLTYFSEELARHVILQVAHAIRYLHEEKGVIHRDIKPENLLFDNIPIIPSKHQKARPYDEEKEDEGEFVPGIGGGGIGRVKIADFGLSKIVWNEETMTPCGTVGYTAPEIVKDERYSKSVDMWALGCVLYTLLCGFPPFYDESINVLTEKVARGYYTFLSPWWDDISASSKDLIAHLLCVDPDKRFTIDEFLAHPWCHEKAPRPNLNPQEVANLPPPLVNQKAQQMPMDSPLMQDRQMGGRAMPSPGVAQLREAFDVTYAVHRMEEEGARRRAYNGPGGAGARGFLNQLNEEDEDEDIEITRRKYGNEVSAAIQEKQARQARERAEEEAAIAAGSKPRTKATTQGYQGWGGADRKLAEATLYSSGRAGTRDTGRRNNFDLTLNNATLLGRRNKAGTAPTPSLGGLPPMAPMRVD
ncbi:hypothetical protein E5Q_04106 [Mixia osmundae IAM 14324]|uniref:Protein kinase domain-containing protein n=1 Tax=Mixia osmundae (strain CBS 9802 / IAM 14324 / JCM 22182 / KY 12970) TaxID=764103 RepID=G7E3L8_MIXOS|nr:hypothetical protein E5Q_04106 [Mixia osmundae IAM 14324]